MHIDFDPQAVEDIDHFKRHDPQLAKKVTQLVANIREMPFTGLGKPEALKYEYSGCWSRRLNYLQRLVYRVDEGRIVILQCRYHYG